MSARSFRFIHASDLHLERPIAGLPHAPDALVERLVDAPLDAAKKIFDAALDDDAAFVILSGDVVDPQTSGPRPLAFLWEQFDRLAARDIKVYWATGPVDAADRWPAGMPFPKNVHRFGAQAEPVIHLDGEEPIAAICGKGYDGALRASDFRSPQQGLFTVAAAYGSAPVESLTQHKPIGYWALGGEHRRRGKQAGKQLVHHPGTPQGRSSDEAGEFGFTSVQVESTGQTRLKFVAADSARWCHERLEVRDDAARDELERLLRRRLQAISSEAKGRAVLLCWTIAGAARLASALRNAGLAEELIRLLREEFGAVSPPVWTVSLSCEAPAEMPESWREEDTILGDFLRAADFAQGKSTDAEDASLFDTVADTALLGLLPNDATFEELKTAAHLGDAALRERSLRDAAILGADLLRGVET